MAIDKINIKYNNPVMDQENIEKIADKVNEIIDTPSGTEVIANPVGANNALTGLQIGDDKYYIDTTYGKPLYVHNIRFSWSNNTWGLSSKKIFFSVILPTDGAFASFSAFRKGLSNYYSTTTQYYSNRTSYFKIESIYAEVTVNTLPYKIYVDGLSFVPSENDTSVFASGFKIDSENVMTSFGFTLSQNDMSNFHDDVVLLQKS